VILPTSRADGNRQSGRRCDKIAPPAKRVIVLEMLCRAMDCNSNGWLVIAVPSGIVWKFGVAISPMQ